MILLGLFLTIKPQTILGGNSLQNKIGRNTIDWTGVPTPIKGSLFLANPTNSITSIGKFFARVPLCSISSISKSKIYGDGGVDVTGAPMQKLVEGANCMLLACKQHDFGSSNLFLNLFFLDHTIIDHSQHQKTKELISGTLSPQNNPKKQNRKLIHLNQISLTDVIFPKHLDGVESPMLSDEASTHPEFTGYPFLDVDGNLLTLEDHIYLTEKREDIQVSWSDEEVKENRWLTKILRTWVIYDFKGDNTYTNIQIIHRLDVKPAKNNMNNTPLSNDKEGF